VTSSFIVFFGGLSEAGADTWCAELAGRGKKTRVRQHVYVLELPVVRASTGGVDETPRDTRNEELVGDLELDDRIEHLFPRGEHRVEFLCLRDRTRETVERKAVLPTRERKKKEKKLTNAFCE